MNTWTKRLEFLYVKKGFKKARGDRWDLEHTDSFLIQHNSATTNISRNDWFCYF